MKRRKMVQIQVTNHEALIHERHTADERMGSIVDRLEPFLSTFLLQSANTLQLMTEQTLSARHKSLPVICNFVLL
jgi:hypothetical protein